MTKYEQLQIVSYFQKLRVSRSLLRRFLLGFKTHFVSFGAMFIFIYKTHLNLSNLKPNLSY